MTKDCLLVVDDDALNRKAVGFQLSRTHHVLEAASCLEAIHILQLVRVKVLLTDLNLGAGSSGVDLLSYVLDEHPQIRRVLMSGLMRPPVAEQLLATHTADAVLCKPWDRGELLHAIAGR